MSHTKFDKGIKVDGTDNFVQKGKIYIEFFHLPSRQSVAFKAYITSFNENYDVQFEQTDVYGRMDPIAIYKGTKRKISLGWSVVAESDEEAFENWKNVQKYIKMLYPSYNTTKFGKGFSATTLGAPPLLRMKFMNIIANARRISLNKSGFPVESVKFSDGNAKNAGLLVVPGGLTVDPQFADRGALIYNQSGMKLGEKGLNQNQTLPPRMLASGSPFALPYEIALSTDYTVLHDHPLGFSKQEYIKGGKKGRAAAQASRLNISALNKSLSGKSGKNPGVFTLPKSARKDLEKTRAMHKNIIKSLTGQKTSDRGPFRKFPYGIKE